MVCLVWTRCAQRQLYNIVYTAPAKFIEVCSSLDILCSVHRKLFILVFPAMEEVMSAAGHSVSFHNCMHGGARNKLTKWWATDKTFEELRVFCDGSHSHAKWNPQPVGKSLQFPTAAEAASLYFFARGLWRFCSSMPSNRERKILVRCRPNYNFSPLDFGHVAEGKEAQAAGQRISRLYILFECSELRS